MSSGSKAGNDHKDLYARLLRERIIFLGTAIDDDTASSIIDQLRFLDAEDAVRDITLYITSPGGSVQAGMAIYNTMQQIQPDIVTVCPGMAASMAAILLSAGTKGKRMALSNARLMINRPEGGKQVQHPDDQTSATWQQRQQLELGYHRQSLTEILAFHTGQSVERIYQDTESDYFLSPLEAQQYGIIDQVLERRVAQS